MHDWGDEDADWVGINAAAEYIAHFLRYWLRLSVVDYKEKHGTVRVYMHGLHYTSLHQIWKPGYVYNQFPYHWMWTFDIYYGQYVVWILNQTIARLNPYFYRWIYKRACQKWPHLKKEILCCSDYPDLLEGL